MMSEASGLLLGIWWALAGYQLGLMGGYRLGPEPRGQGHESPALAPRCDGDRVPVLAGEFVDASELGESNL